MILGGLSMSTLTVRLPGETAACLNELAERRGMSVNKLFKELRVQAIAAFDAETRFRAVASRGAILGDWGAAGAAPCSRAKRTRSRRTA